ncbi:MAG: dihydrofolate reductase [Alphaproteobacteria bacterium]
MNIKTSLIVAMAQNNCIGKDNKMPWHISDDLKRFKSLTMDHPVIMGRKTYESIIGYLNKPLPGRTNIVISRSGFDNKYNVPVFADIKESINHAKIIAKENNKDEIFIIGGAQIYTQSINIADRIHLTKVYQDVDGDAFFPDFNEDNWDEDICSTHKGSTPPYSFITLTRK